MAADDLPPFAIDQAANDAALPPPHNDDAERAVLSVVMIDPGALAKVRDYLSPEHFYSEAHRRLYEACLDLASGGPPDVVRVAAWLRDHDRVAQVGGVAYLTEVLNSAPVAENVVRYAELVRESWSARQGTFISQRVDAQLRAGLEPRGVLAAAANDLAKLAEDGTTRGPVRVLTAAELWAPRPPVPFAVARILPRSGVAMLVATGSSLKTWAVLDLVIAKATGGKWLGRFECEKGPALFVDWESGEDELARRLQRLSPEPVDGVAAVSMPSLFLNSPGFETAIRRLAETYSLIAFDSLAGGTVDLDENDARFARALYMLKGIATATGSTVVVLHHTRKAKEGDDERERPRGTSALFAAVDVVLQLSRARDGVFRCTQTKARGGKAVEPFDVTVEDIDERATRVVALDSQSAIDDEASDVRSVNATKSRIVQLLASEKDIRSANEVCRRLKGTKATKLEALHELEERGTVVKVDGVYRLTSEVK